MTGIILKHSSTAGKIPLATDLQVGEAALNTADGLLYTKHTDNSIKSIGALATQASIGLGNVNNTSDANKPLSNANVSALALKANLASPVLSGTPTAPTAVISDNSTTLATTAFVVSKIQAVIGVAPAALDTLVEISTQLIADESAVSALVITIAGKQDALVSATTIKTVNGISLLGSGDIALVATSVDGGTY
jgi:hypothetical protein